MAAVLDVSKSSQLLYSSILTFLLVCLCYSSADRDLTCNNVKSAYKSRGFNEFDVPNEAVSGSHLEICSQDVTCCTKDMEQKLSSQSQKEYEELRHATIQNVINTFGSRTLKFDEFFSELLENSKQDLHVMFVKTYGLLYKQNAHIFKELFTELKNYYKGKNLNLSQVLNGFFVKLLRRMFQLLNQQHKFSEQYLNCVVKHMNQLEPFGDVPGKLSKQVKRSFVAARTFVQGLAIGRDVVEAVDAIPPTGACSRALMKLMYCPHCHGLTETKPCTNFCLNTMKGCLASLAELNTVWNEYINALMMVANRLEGPFNIESVVEPIDVQISDAIMNFQENGIKVSERIFQGCGRPPLGRRRRTISASSIEENPNKEPQQENPNKNDTSYDSSSWQYKPEKQTKPTTAAGTSLDRLVRDIKEKIEVAKDYWITLPNTICESHLSSGSTDGDDCWNGQDNARYIPNVQKDGVENQLNNPEVEVDVTRRDPIVILQIQQLKLITKRLQKAYSGNDVEWLDVDMEFSGAGGGGSSYSGFGDDELSGSGSGDRGSADDGGDGSDGTDTSPDTGDGNQYYFLTPNATTTRSDIDSGVSRTGVSLCLSSVVILLTVCVTRWLS